MSSTCSICEKIWCADHVAPGIRNCRRCFLQEKSFFDYFSVFPSCFQAEKKSGEHFKLCKCKAQLACNDYAEEPHENCGYLGFEILDLFCSKCKSAGDVMLEIGSEYCSDFSDDDSTYARDQIARQQQMEDDMDDYCL